MLRLERFKWHGNTIGFRPLLLHYCQSLCATSLGMLYLGILSNFDLKKSRGPPGEFYHPLFIKDFNDI